MKYICLKKLNCSLYAAEIWTTKSSGPLILLAFKVHCYRPILAVKWQGHGTNEEIWRTGTKESSDMCNLQGDFR